MKISVISTGDKVTDALKYHCATYIIEGTVKFQFVINY